MTSHTKTLLIAGALLFLVLAPGTSSAESIIKEFEGFRSTAYLDSGSYAVGYGTHYNYDLGRPVHQGDKISQPTALKWLRIINADNNATLNSLVKRSINQNQRAALLSLMYNIGSGAFAASTLLKKLNAGASIKDVAAEFDKWVYDNDVKINDLVVRRAKEKQLFLS